MKVLMRVSIGKTASFSSWAEEYKSHSVEHSRQCLERLEEPSSTLEQLWKHSPGEA